MNHYHWGGKLSLWTIFLWLASASIKGVTSEKKEIKQPSFVQITFNFHDKTLDDLIKDLQVFRMFREAVVKKSKRLGKNKEKRIPFFQSLYLKKGSDDEAERILFNVKIDLTSNGSGEKKNLTKILNEAIKKEVSEDFSAELAFPYPEKEVKRRANSDIKNILPKDRIHIYINYDKKEPSISSSLISGENNGLTALASFSLGTFCMYLIKGRNPLNKKEKETITPS